MPKPLIQSYYFLLLSPCSCFAKYFYAMNKIFKNLEEIRRNYHHEVLAHVLQATETKAYILKWPSVSVTEGWKIHSRPQRTQCRAAPANKAAQHLMHTVTSQNKFIHY